MSTLLSILEKYDDYVCMPQGATADEIEAAETALGVRFSDEYKAYTEQAGSACADGHEFTGVVKAPRLNVLTVTLEAKEKNPNITDGLYVVEALNVDGILLWQDQDGKVYESGYQDTPRVTASSLAEYMEM